MDRSGNRGGCIHRIFANLELLGEVKVAGGNNTTTLVVFLVANEVSMILISRSPDVRQVLDDEISNQLNKQLGQEAHLDRKSFPSSSNR